MLSQPRTSSQTSRYRILGLVGQGQFGQVFCAIHRKTGKLFALKNLEQERFPTHQFLRELRFLLSLQHPNIVTCHAIEHTQTGRYLVMDYCEGGTLRNLMVEDMALPLNQSLHIVADVLSGLANAHQQGIVHCDIKPENILLSAETKGWRAKISDFGIARLNQEVYSQTTGNTGSPAYMAPERFYSQYSAASDIYAVGILLFELLVGHRPFTGTPKALMDAHLNHSAECPKSIPLSLQKVIQVALQKLPSRRFQSASAMLHSLRAAISEPDVSDKWCHPQKLEHPLLLLSQEVPYYDSTPQEKRPVDYLVNSIEGLWENRTHLRSHHNHSGPPLRITQVTALAQTTADKHSTIPLFPSYLAYVGAEYLTSRAFTVTPQPGLHIETHAHQSSDNQDRSIHFSEPIQQLLPTPSGFVVLTTNQIFWLQDTYFSAHQSLSAEREEPMKPLYLLKHPCVAAIESHGHWLAVVTDERHDSDTKSHSQLSLHRLPCSPGAMALPNTSIPLRVAHRAKDLLQAIALDKRHLAIISDGPHPKSKNHTPPTSLQTSDQLTPLPRNMNRATYIEILTRRGQRLGLQYLPMKIDRVIKTTKPYQLLALDCYDPGSILCIDLKPFRLQRFVLDIHPRFLAATDWGYIAADGNGKIIFLDTSGYAVSGLNGPENLTSMTFLAPQFLILATWDGTEGFVHTLDLKEQMTHWVF